MEMKSSLFSLIVLVFLVKGFKSETSVANQASNSGATCGPMLDNILRLERAVNNISWELELAKTDLKTTKIEQKSTTRRLETTVKDFETTRTDLVAIRAALKSTEDKLATVISTCSRLDIMEERMEEIANSTEKIGGDKDISFQVKQIKRPYTVGQFESLKFDDVTLNKGGGYNPTSGIFTVPRNGTYLCWSNILSQTSNNFSLRLMKEGKEIVRGYTGADQSYGTAVITYLKTFTEGEHVWFDVFAGSLSIAGENYSSYGCHLMYVKHSS